MNVPQETYPEVSVASRISGTGMAVPERVITNEHFASYLETSDEWIRERTGIIERRWAEAGVSISELAEPAALDAIEAAGLDKKDIDAVIFATVTPDYQFPSTACFLQKRLGLPQGMAFDVNAVCSGFVYALVVGDSLIKAGQAKNILVVGADMYSRIINPNDRGTCILFGDGAGAVVLSAVAEPAKPFGIGGFISGSAKDVRGVYHSTLSSDGRHAEILCVPRGTAAEVTVESLQTDAHYLRMEGREVFKMAVRRLAQVSQQVLDEAGVDISQVDHFVSHQANKRILQAMAKQLGVTEERVPMNLEKYGNTSAATIPILLAEMARDGSLSKGDLVLLSALGGGVTWGAALLRW